MAHHTKLAHVVKYITYHHPELLFEPFLDMTYSK